MIHCLCSKAAPCRLARPDLFPACRSHLRCQEKLGSEHKLTRLTRDQLLDIVEREKQLGARALNQAKGGDDEMFKVAEVRCREGARVVRAQVVVVAGSMWARSWDTAELPRCRHFVSKCIYAAVHLLLSFLHALCLNYLPRPPCLASPCPTRLAGDVQAGAGHRQAGLP